MTRTRFRALATDFDRTLTDKALAVQPRTLAALDRARAGGLRVIVVSGRPLAVLRAAVPNADAIVAENGLVCWTATPQAAAPPGLPGAAPPAAAPPAGPGSIVRAPWKDRQAVLEVLTKAGVPVEASEALITVPGASRAAVEAALKGKHDVQLISNLEALMVLPRGVDKGTGLALALSALGISPGETVAIGDGENDVPILRMAGLAAVPSNATAEAKATAQLLLGTSYGEAVVELVDRTLRELAQATLAAGRVSPRGAGRRA